MASAADVGAFDPRLLQSMIDAGLVDEKDAALKDQLATARALRGTQMPQGRMVGNVFVASSPLEMAAAALNQGVGAWKEGQVGKERAALMDTRRQGREAAAGMFGQPGQAIDSGSLLAADEPTFAEQQTALLAKLRGEQAAASQAAASGDPVISGMAKSALEDSRRREETLTGLANTRLQRAIEAKRLAQQTTSQDRDYGLQERRLKLDESRTNQELGLKRGQLEQDAWGTIADPVTGGIVMYNKKTGEVRPLGPGGGSPGTPGTSSGGPLPGLPGKPTDAQRKAVLEKSQGIAQLDIAIDALKKAPGAYGGAGNYIAALGEQIGGTPAQSLLSRRYKPEELTAKNQISNVVSAIINQRAGANVTYREELRQKFLPQDTDSYDQALQKLTDLRNFETAAYQAQGNGMLPAPDASSASPSSAPATGAAAPIDRDALRKKYGL